MKLVWSEQSWNDYLHWQMTARDLQGRINDLIKDIKRAPFSGLGKPEPLKGDLAGWWSRRIDLEHRLVYRISGKSPYQSLEIASCRFHY